MKYLLLCLLLFLSACTTTNHLLDGNSGWILTRQLGSDVIYWCSVNPTTVIAPTCYQAEKKELAPTSLFHK